MAVSQEDILARIEQIYTNMGATPEANAQIVRDANQFGVTPEQIGQAANLSASRVRSLAEEAGESFTPTTMTGGMLGGSSVDLTTPTTMPTIGQPSGVTVDVPRRTNIDLTTPPTSGVSITPTGAESPTVGMLQPEQYTPSITSNTLSQIQTGDQFAFSDLLFNLNTSDRNLTELKPAIEEIARTATGNQGTDPAYNFLVQSAAEAKLKDDYNNAVSRGDTTKASEIRTAVLGGPTTSYAYYLTQYPEGSAHKMVQDTFSDPFGIGDPGKYQTGFFENIGDAVSDVVQNPYVQAVSAFIPGVGPAVSSVLQAWGTLDSGEELSPAQIVAAVAGASELSGLEGGNLVKMLPKEVQGTVTAIQNALEGGFDEAYSALKDAGLEGTSEQFAAFEDAIRNVVGDENIEAVSGSIAGIEDAIRGVIGDENIEAFSSGLAGIEDLIRGQFGSQQDQLDALTEALASEGGGFTPQRGYQPGLPVDIEFDQPERSAVLDILNQPSSVQRTS